MGLLSNLFQQQQQIAQNPASVVRTPQQQAYDNLLNRQYDIEQQNKKYNTFNGIMQGAGGLGKILASAFVKDPMQQYGAMQGLGEQETRTDNLRQAYNLARMAQNKDYVQQAKEQLDLANADDERNYNRELTKNQIAYKKAMDLLEQQNKDRQFEFAKEQAGIENKNKADMLELQKSKINAEIGKLNAEIKASNNNSQTTKDLIDSINLQNKQNEQKILEKENEQMLKNAKDDLNTGKISQAEYDLVVANPQFYKEILKQKRENTKYNMQLADTYAGREEITPELKTAIKNNPILGDYLVSSGKYNDGSYVGNVANAVTGGLVGKFFGIGKNPNKYTLDFAQIIRDKTGNEPTKKEIAKLKKDLGLKDD